jgi:hypothetical protein
VLDLDNGAVSALPLDDLQRRVGSSYEGSYTLGRVASTGQHKVFRVVSQYSLHCPAGRFNERVEQHCHVFTLGDDDRRCWRPVASAPLCVDFLIIRRHVVAHSAAIDGVVYFMPHKVYPSFHIFRDDLNLRINRVMAFDLETEEWRPAMLAGPPIYTDCDRKLANLDGNLAMLRHSHDHIHGTVSIDVWFATDLVRGARSRRGE